MKFVLRPQRRRDGRAESRIALFPFLAVLICTMGALVPLLMAITRAAKRQAEAAALAKVADQTTDVQTGREDAQWRIEHLKQSRRKTEDQLADARLHLGHLEEHERRLREQLEQRKKTLHDLDRLERTDLRRSSEIKAELQLLRGQIEAAARRLAEARNAAAAKKPSYAIVPYEGPNQTHRRPIYVECRADAVVLQPEGIELTDSDFDGPLGPGNPLAAALRAAREYMLAQKDFDLETGEPYPMLLVRPEGINAYYAARAALTSWGSDFGYELIGDDWKLAFQPPDPRLARLVRQVVASARTSQARLAEAAPSHRGARTKVVYRAKPSGGGFVREEVTSNSAAGGYRPVRPAGPVAAQRSEGRGAWDEGSGPGNGGWHNPEHSEGRASPGSHALRSSGRATQNSSSYSDFEGGGYGDSPGSPTRGVAADANPLRGTNAATSPGTEGGHDPEHSEGRASPGSHALRSSGQDTRNSSSNSDVVPYAAAGTASSRPRNSYANGCENGLLPEGYVVGRPPREQDPSGLSPDGVTGRPLLPGQWEPTPPPPQSPDKDRKDDKPDERRGGCSTAKSLTAKRGKDWALRDAAGGSVGIRRPIRLECHADRLVVLSDRGPADNKVVPLGPRLGSSIDTLISAVWEQMEAWGIAGRSMYWRPVLKVSVAPDGEQRFDELSALLEGSGMIVERK